jgi:hypothetical protein
MSACCCRLAHGYIEIDTIYTALALPVIISSKPLAWPSANEAEIAYIQASPTSARRQSSPALAGKLKHQNVFDRAFQADRMRAALANQPVVCADHLRAVDNGLAK